MYDCSVEKVHSPNSCEGLIGRTVGVGVDTHVHRIANLLKWADAATPEKTRVALESWLPTEYWGPINPQLVGFGQTVCLPRVPKCGECKLAEEGICPFAKKGLKMWREREAKKKVVVKKELDIKVETDGIVETVQIKTESSPLKTLQTEITEPESSPLKPVKEETIAGYHIEHFSAK